MDIDLSGGNHKQAKALNIAAAHMTEAASFDWLSADKARRDVQRLSERLFDLTRVCDQIAAALESTPVPAGHYQEQRRDALDGLNTYLKGTSGLIGELGHPSRYGRDTL